jgi:hypothetical protein
VFVAGGGGVFVGRGVFMTGGGVFVAGRRVFVGRGVFMTGGGVLVDERAVFVGRSVAGTKVLISGRGVFARIWLPFVGDGAAFVMY